MADKESEKKFTTQRVDFGTLDLIKTIKLHLSRRGKRLNQSDLIHLAFVFIKNREWEFIEFVESKADKKSGGLFDTVFEVASRPRFFPSGDLEN